MSTETPVTLRRERFMAPSATAQDSGDAKLLLDLLIAQDGSTTRLCETVAGGAISVHVLHQEITSQVPATVREHLPGTRFIERITSLVAHGQVMMDNLSYIALHGLEREVEAALLSGETPIGHLLARWWVRRVPLPALDVLPQQLWSAVGLPDPQATRVYRIDTPESPRMLIAETFRRGMRMDRFGH